MGACATKPGDLKVKGDAPLAMDDAAEKEKAKADDAAAEADAADAGRRRSLSDLLKQDSETSDDAGGEAGQEAAKAVAAEPASAAGDAAGAVMGMGEDQPSSQEAPVQASVAAAEQQDGTAQELQVGARGDGDAQEAEEEKRVVPESVQVAAAPCAEDGKPADDDASA
ncbi:hypothetical protein BS78_04G156800 [Paspalum vaginatum]|nr:hypothetical protein BS78_04G156800 [Paspalum vaginatum]